MARRKVRDYHSMTIEQLRATIREARAQERAARYTKVRRSWKSVWQEAEAELARRGLSA